MREPSVTASRKFFSRQIRPPLAARRAEVLCRLVGSLGSELCQVLTVDTDLMHAAVVD